VGLFPQQRWVRDAIARAEQFSDLAANASDPANQFVGDLMIGMSQHYLGDQTNARRHIEGMLEGYPDPAPVSHTIRFYYEQRSLAQAVLARVLWLQGFPDQAMHIARSIAESAQSQNHVPTACRILAMGAFPIALRVGDLAAAEHFLAVLFDRAASHLLDRYVFQFARCLEGMLLMKRGNVISGLEHLGAGTDELRDTGFTPDYPTFLGAMAEGLAGAGRVVRAWRPSRKRLRDPCVAVNSGAWRTCYASKARLSSVRARAALPPWLRTTSSKAWTWRAGKVRVPGNYAASPASPGCGATRLGAKRRASSWRRCTIGLQRASRSPTSERPRRCSKS